MVYKGAALATKILPDDTSGAYMYYNCDNDEIYLDSKFKITNKYKYDIRLDDLISNFSLTYGDGYTYDSCTCFYSPMNDDISPVFYKNLEPLKSATIHVTCTLPKEASKSDKKITAKFYVGTEEQILKFR